MFSHPVLPPAVFAFGIFHPWLFLNENQWVKIPKVILYSDTFFPFYIVHIIEPSEWADVAYSLHCSGPFPSLSSHHFLSLCMTIFLTVPFLSFMPGKCTSKTQKCTTINNAWTPKALMHQCPSLETSFRPLVSNISCTIWTELCRWCKNSCSTLGANLMKTDHLHSNL